MKQSSLGDSSHDVGTRGRRWLVREEGAGGIVRQEEQESGGMRRRMRRRRRPWQSEMWTGLKT